MINLSRVFLNPDFRQIFKVYRSSGSFISGRWTEDVQSPPSFDMGGIVWPSTAKEIEQVPEGDRVIGMMTFASTEKLYTTHASGVAGTSDKIEWKDELYKLIQALPFDDYGFNVAVGARMAGD